MLSSDGGGRKDGEAFPSLSGGAQANGHPLLRDHVLASAAVTAIPAVASAVSASAAAEPGYQLHQRRRRHGVGTLGGRLTTFQILLWAPAVS